MNRLFTTLLTIAALAIALPANASHCTASSTSSAEIQTDGLAGSVYYIDNDVCQPECLFSLWVYEESNGRDGLQRGDEFVDDTCHGMIEADTIVL